MQLRFPLGPTWSSRLPKYPNDNPKFKKKSIHCEGRSTWTFSGSEISILGGSFTNHDTEFVSGLALTVRQLRFRTFRSVQLVEQDYVELTCF